MPAPVPAPVVACDAGTAHDDAAATLDHGVVATRNTDGTPAGLWLDSMLGTTRTTRRTRRACGWAQHFIAHRVSPLAFFRAFGPRSVRIIIRE